MSIYFAGQLPSVNGELPAQGVLGCDVSVEKAQELARLAALNALPAATTTVGELESVRVLQMMVFVARTAEFEDQARVADAASELLLAVLGERPTRANRDRGCGAAQQQPGGIQMVCAEADQRRLEAYRPASHGRTA